MGSIRGAHLDSRMKLLVADSILSLCFLLSEGLSETLTITVEPPTLEVGQSVSLKLETIHHKSVSCRWYRGAAADENLILNYYLGVAASIKGAAYIGRETVSSDCSLHITNLNSSDSGIYRVMVDNPPTSEFGRVELKVVDRTKSILSTSFPLSHGQGDTNTISVEPPTPQVGQSVTLKLETLPERSVSCRWYRGGPADENLILNYYLGVSESIMGAAYNGPETVGSDCSLHITNLNSSDSGIYSVTVDSPPTSETRRVELKVVG